MTLSHSARHTAVTLITTAHMTTNCTTTNCKTTTHTTTTRTAGVAIDSESPKDQNKEYNSALTSHNIAKALFTQKTYQHICITRIHGLNDMCNVKNQISELVEFIQATEQVK